MDFLHFQFLFSFKRCSKNTNFPVFSGVSFALICVKIVAFFHYYNITLNKHLNYNLNFTCILLLFFCIYNSLTYKKETFHTQAYYYIMKSQKLFLQRCSIIINHIIHNGCCSYNFTSVNVVITTFLLTDNANYAIE